MWPIRTCTSLSAISRILIIAFAFALAGCGERLSRDDFAALVKDKTTTEVAARIGKPDAVDESIGGTIRWTYTSKTFSVEGGTKMDAKTVVVFRQTAPNTAAKAVEVLYQ
jgi:hypothetical protein